MTEVNDPGPKSLQEALAWLDEVRAYINHQPTGPAYLAWAKDGFSETFGDFVYPRVAGYLRAYLPNAQSDADLLKQWKQLFEPILAFAQDNGKALGIPLGGSITEFVMNMLVAKVSKSGQVQFFNPVEEGRLLCKCGKFRSAHLEACPTPRAEVGLLAEAMDLLENWPLPKMGNPLREELAADRKALRRKIKVLATADEMDPLLVAFAKAAGFTQPPDNDGFWNHPEIGIVHADALDAVLLEMIKARFEKGGPA